MSTEDLNLDNGADVLSMSDAEIADMDLFSTGLVPEENTDEPVDESTEDQGDPAEEFNLGDTDTDTEDDDLEGEEADDDPTGSEEESGDDDLEEDTDDEDSTTEEGETTESTDDGINYQAEYEKILAPFKANGREIQVDSVDDAITLMSMGANYNKKMAALKPHLKVVRTLENNKLLAESDINYLIDLHNKKPEAISRLIKESGIDPLDIDTDNAEGYQPEAHTVSDQEMELDSVLDSIKDTQTYAATVNLVSEQWDEGSRDVILKNPQIIKVINDQKQNGIFDQITKVVEQERMLGRLEGQSDLEAYRAIGDRLHAAGKFGQPQSQTNTEAETPKTVTVTPKQKDPKLKSRKKAASSSKPRSVQKQNSEFNPLDLPDDEFEKLTANKYR